MARSFAAIIRRRLEGVSLTPTPCTFSVAPKHRIECECEQGHLRRRSALRQLSAGQANAGSLQHRFVSAAKESVRAVDIAVRDVETGKVSCDRPMNSRIYGLPSTQRAVDVLDELKPEGYVFGSNSD